MLIPFGISFPSAMTGTNEEVSMLLPLVLFSQQSMNCLLIWKKACKQVEMPRDSVPLKQVIAELEF